MKMLLSVLLHTKKLEYIILHLLISTCNTLKRLLLTADKQKVHYF